MKILHLLNSNSFSGAENVVCQIINMFNDNDGISMAYCCPRGPIEEVLKAQGICFFPLEEFSIKSFKHTIRLFNPDIIQAHDMRASLLASTCCQKTPLVSQIHNNSYQSRGLSLKSFAFIIPAIRAKHIFWVSKSAYEDYAFIKMFKSKSTVLRNIIDIDALYNKMNNDRHNYEYDLVYVGRLAYPKNPERLVHILDKACQIDNSIRVAIVGSGDLEESIRQTVNYLHLDGNISFLGFVSNPLKIISDAKVMVMTSRWEGTPMCALEALSLGTPIVSTPTDGLMDLVVDGMNGYLSDNDDEIANRIIELLHDPERCNAFSENAIKRMRVLMDKESYKKALEEVYYSAVR